MGNHHLNPLYLYPVFTDQGHFNCHYPKLHVLPRCLHELFQDLGVSGIQFELSWLRLDRTTDFPTEYVQVSTG